MISVISVVQEKSRIPLTIHHELQLHLIDTKLDVSRVT